MVSSFKHMMVLHGNLKSQEQLLEMEEIDNVPVSGKHLISSITWLFQSTENYSELANHQFQLVPKWVVSTKARGRVVTII
jgi:hypothetical protein